MHLANSNTTIKVAQLKSGTRVRLGDSIATVSSMRFLNGRDGGRTHLISFKGRTAAALEVSFLNHKPIIAHFDQDVILPTN